mmetsp:Transcript_1923/g.3889  ORF Transcript_1923/g.3889 Transcript_1923/m.3889 type:complete len:303 (+) Transcript_1923:214-1122(+)
MASEASNEASNEASSGTISAHLKAVWERVIFEAVLVISGWPWIFVKVLFAAYVVQLPFRNLAYFRHQSRATLKDLGFEWIPEMREEDKWISELVLQTLHTIGVFALIVPWLSPYPHSNNIFGVHLAEKWLDCLCVGHTLRFFTYISTSLPGPAKHCRPGAPQPEQYRPTSLSEILTRQTKGEDRNCGDLVFSGHVFQNIILSILVTTYAHKLFQWRWFRVFIPITMWGLTIAQAPLVISARNHYTVDIVVAVYLAPLVWIALERFYVSEHFRALVKIVRPLRPKWTASYKHIADTIECDTAL